MHRSEKDKRYDRQLRLWGDHGQFALEYAKVCLLRAEGLGAEILKNLVLPGIPIPTQSETFRRRQFHNYR